MIMELNNVTVEDGVSPHVFGITFSGDRVGLYKSNSPSGRCIIAADWCSSYFDFYRFCFV